MATRGRKPGFVMSDAHRVKIQKSNILRALIDHVEGTREMSSTQVTAGIALLRKVLPDLSNVELSGPGGGPIQTEAGPNEHAAAVLAALARKHDAG
jgi:hypothetical protein